MSTVFEAAFHESQTACIRTVLFYHVLSSAIGINVNRKIYVGSTTSVDASPIIKNSSYVL